MRSFVTLHCATILLHKASRRFHKTFEASGAQNMDATKIIRLLLTISFILSLAIAYQSDRTAYSVSSPVFAQASSQGQPPPLQRKKSNPENDRDQDNPKGRTAISVAVDLVSLQVLVSDTKGNVLTGLKPENFTIYEDNVKQQISHFSPIDANITVVMLVEYSNNISYFIDQIWNSMIVFTSSLRKGDWVGVIGYDLNPTILCDFTQDRQKVYDTLNRFRYPSFDESNLSDALIDTLDRVEEIEGKVAILLISTGLDTLSKHTYDEALQKCKESSVSVYPISLGQRYRIIAEQRGRLSSLQMLDLLMADNRLRSFAEFSGGEAYFPRFDTELPDIVKNISTLLRSQYSIAYASTNTQKDGKFRKIRVEVNANITDSKGKPVKLKVVTRKGYIPKES
jgi:Ca-activated chloride channel homolog